MDRALLYQSLAQLVDAGVPFGECVRSLRGALRNPGSRRVLSALDAAVARNEPLSEGLKSSPRDIPPYHARALHAAEQSGNPAKILRGLAAQETNLHDNQKELIRRSAYPLLLAHFAMVAPAAGALLMDPVGAALELIAIIVPIDIALLLLFRSLTTPVRSLRWSEIALRVPAVGRATRDRDHGQYFSALHQLYEAGIPLHEAADQALDAVQNAAVAVELSTIPRMLAEHQPLGAAVALVPGIRSEPCAILTTAEPAGELGDGLARAGELASAQGDTGCRRVIRAATGALYVVALLYVAFKVISFWSAYWGQLSDL